MRGRRPFILAFAAATAATVGVHPRLTDAAASTPRIEHLLGTYRYVGGSSERQEIERAIDDVVDQMNLLIRGLARRRLKEPNLPTSELTLEIVDHELQIARSGQPPIRAPLDGRAVRWRNPQNGNQLTVHHRVTREGAVEQRLQGDRGTSINELVVSDDGRDLAVHTLIRADKLPSPIRFTASYERTTAANEPD